MQECFIPTLFRDAVGGVCLHWHSWMHTFSLFFWRVTASSFTRWSLRVYINFHTLTASFVPRVSKMITKKTCFSNNMQLHTIRLFIFHCCCLGFFCLSEIDLLFWIIIKVCNQKNLVFILEKPRTPRKFDRNYPLMTSQILRLKPTAISSYHPKAANENLIYK